MLNYFLFLVPHNTMINITKASSRDEIVSHGEEYMDWQDQQLELALKVRETETQKTNLIFTLLAMLILLWGYIIW